MPLQTCHALLARGPRDYRWERAAGPIPMAHYQEAIDRLAARARTVPGVIGVYDLGPIRYPGLSDVDLLFVVEDGFHDFASLRPLLRAAQPSELHDVLLHDPYFIRRGELAQFLHFAPIFQLRALWTAEGLPAGITLEDPIDAALFLADIVAESYPREFIQFLLAPALEERTLVSRLKGLAYCFDLWGRLASRREPAFDAYTAEITELRENFFKIPVDQRSARLLALTQRAVALAHELALKTSALLAERWGLRVEGRLDLFCAYDPAIYSDAAAAAEPRYGSLRLRRTEVYALAPAVFGWLVRQYAMGEGPFSARLRSRLRDRLAAVAPPPREFVEAVRRRAALRNHHTAWVDASGLGLSSFLTFGYRVRRRLAGPRALKEAAGRLSDRLREVLLRREMGKVKS